MIVLTQFVYFLLLLSSLIPENILCVGCGSDLRHETPSGNKKILHIGVLAQKSLKVDDSEYMYIKSVCHFIMERYNKNLSKHGYEVDFIYKDSGCNSTLSVGAATELVNRNVSALLGPSCSPGCLPVGLLATFENIPMISFGCSSGALSDKSVYPTFARTMPYARTVPKYLKGMVLNSLKEFNWDHIGIVYSTGQSWSGTFSEIRDIILSSNTTTINPLIPIEAYVNKQEIVRLLKENCRIVLLLCYETDIMEILTYAYQSDMHSGDYAFITIDFELRIENWRKQDWYIGSKVLEGILNIGVRPPSEGLGEEKHKKFVEKLNNILYDKLDYDVYDKNISFFKEAGYTYDAAKLYIAAVLDLIIDEENRRRTEFLNITKMDQFLEMNNLTLPLLKDIHDSIETDVNSTWRNRTWIYPSNWTYSSNDTLPIMNCTYEIDFDPDPIIRNGTLLMGKIYNSDNEGKSGRVRINNEGDRFPYLIFDNIHVLDDLVKFERAFELDVLKDDFIVNQAVAKIIFPGGGGTPPRAIPLCGFDGEFCSGPPMSSSTMMLLVVAPIGSIAGIYILYKLYKKQQYENDLLNQKSVFKFPELEIPQLIAREKERETELKRLEALKEKEKKTKDSSEDIDDDTSSERNLIVEEMSSSNAALTPKTALTPKAELTPKVTCGGTRRKVKTQYEPDQIFEGIGHINQATGNRYFFAKLRTENVFVKKIPKSTVAISRDILVEMKDVRDLVHANLNSFIGFCLGPPYVLIVTLSCKKGTLQDVLSNENIQLDWVFRNTFMYDVISGLVAIHESPVQFHGHLTSRNILVDNRWNCKITDFGLSKFKDISEEVKKPELDEDARFASLLWTAPENINFPCSRRSKEGDIYAFGIIISEIINRQPPFNSYSQYNPRDHVHFVHKRCIPPFRPHVRMIAGLDGRMLDLMRLCWDEFPENRPTIQQVRATFKNLVKDIGESTNLVDNMIEMMEKYAHELELTVQERTCDLELEKVKCDNLFYRSLPPVIAEQIKKGQAVETKACLASVLAFKVDDFTQFVKMLEPQQSVDLLHDVHKIIETTLAEEETPCHKLQYNKDKCVIVSGAPDEFRNKHALHLARIALKIMGSLTDFRFRHIEDDLIRFKIAVHSGKFVSSIIGLHVPVFTVLGQEVDIAEGLADGIPTLRVFVSAESKKLMDANKTKAVTFENEKVPILVKGHGVVEGYYLKGIKGIRVKLRNPILKNSANNKKSIMGTDTTPVKNPKDKLKSALKKISKDYS